MKTKWFGYTGVSVLALGFTLQGYGKDYSPEVLREIEDKVEETRDAVVVFDLDDTLFETRSRTAGILKELGRDAQIRSQYPAESELLRNVRASSIRYDLRDSLDEVGITDSQLLETAAKFWKDRFFSNEYVLLDEVVMGGALYLQALEQKGAHIVYLTGRDIRGMGLGTRVALMENGFPKGTLILKPDPKMDDKLFKASAIEDIRAMGEVVGVFENEPRNLNLLMKEFPLAIGVFVDTQHSSAPDLPLENAFWIGDYEGE